MIQLLKPALGLTALACIGCSGGYSSPSSGPSAGTVLSTGAAVVARAGATPQSTTAGSPFATDLSVTVSQVETVSNGDGYGGTHKVTTPKAGATVTFTITAGGSGASGTFPGAATTATATSDAAGIAVAPVLTANGATGTFTVTATVTGAPAPATFTLTNS